jgi:hypothetical protein
VFGLFLGLVVIIGARRQGRQKDGYQAKSEAGSAHNLT